MSESPENIIHQGQVSSYDPKTNTARVAFDDWEGMVSGDLQVVQPGTTRMRVKQPLQPGDHVLCLFQANGLQEGYIIGSPYTSSNMPDEGGENDYLMRFPDKDITIRVSAESGKVEVNAPNSEVVSTCKSSSVTASEGITATSKTATVTASESMTTTAPQINLNGRVSANAPDGAGSTTVSFNGTVNIKGTLNVEGSINASGTIIDGGGNTNHHSH